MSLVKDLTPCILAMGIALVNGYSHAAETGLTAQYETVNSLNQLSQADIELASKLNALVTACCKLENGYRSLYKDVAAYSSDELLDLMPPDEFAYFAQKLKELRDLEIMFKNTDVAPRFDQLHMDARRALARGRSWATTFHDLVRQAYGVSELVPGVADAEGLKALAAHTTERLVVLAKA